MAVKIAAEHAENRHLAGELYDTDSAMGLSGADAEEFASLIETVYDAAIKRARWIDALQQVCAFMHCSAGSLLSSDRIGRFNLNVNWGHEPGYWESYQNHYFHLDPLNAWVFRSTAGDVLVASRSPLWPEVLASAYYREWVEPQGFVDCIGATLEKSPSGAAALACVRREDEGLVDDACSFRIGLILPHFRRALMISRLLDQHDLRVGDFVEAMDALSTCVFFLNGAGELVHSNQSGREILAAGEPLCLVGKSLAATDQSSQIDLRQAVHSMLDFRPESRLERVALTISGANGVSYATHLLPLTSGARRHIGLGAAAVIAVFVRATIIDVASAVSAAARFYNFTPAEARVLAEIVDHGGLENVAGRLGVSRRTVQTHLERLFEKTGSKRQADLVKLVAGYESPLRPRA